MEHVHMISVPLPGFPDLMTANMYVLGSGPVTLIDSAPKFPGSLNTVQSQLESFGFTFSDIERIIITHGHIDHFGLASQIKSLSGHDVPCYIHEDDAWRLSRNYLESGMWSEDSVTFIASMGMPEEIAQRMKRRSAFFKNLCDPIDDVLPLQDGDVFTGEDFELVIIHTPGHSPGSICIYEKRRRVLFSGDHILKHITPNPFHEVHRSRLKDPTYKSLVSYLQSLDKLSQLCVERVFTGHGDPLDDLPGLLASYRQHHAQRTQDIWHALENRPRVVFDLIPEVFPLLKPDEEWLAVSEILVHLEILIDEGRAELCDSGPPAMFQAL